MKDILANKIHELGEEARELVEEREKLYASIANIEVRLHQISGAISEIDNILKSQEK